MMKLCKQCNKEFPKPVNCSKKEWSSRLYCSHKCGYESRNIGKQIKTCLTCGNQFTKAYGGKKYCSIQCNPCNFWLGKKRSIETIEKIKKSKFGKTKPNSGSFQKGLTPWNAGIEMPHISGEKHWQWKGGITDINKKIRNGVEYNKWRMEVYKRDYWTCQHCLNKQKYPVAHHIKTFKDYQELRFEVSNGITLCRSCHKKVHSEIGLSTQFGRVFDKLKFA